MFVIPLLLICIGKVISRLDYFHPQVKSCHIGDVVRNECNRCLCTSKAIFECTPIPCSINDKLGAPDDNSPLETCTPNRLYVQNSITCVCTNNGRWPHKNCYESFQSLPSENIETHKCEPNTYVMIDCNVCRCDPDGEFISNRCTKNNCVDGTYHNTRRYNMETIFKKNNLFSNCKAKNWYSFAPCQFCYCVNENKLICNTGTKHNNNVTVGSYDLRQCGKDFIREALELVPNEYKSSRASINSSMISEEDNTNKDALIEENNDDVVSKNDIDNARTEKTNDHIDELNQTYKEGYDSDSQENEDKVSVTNIPAIDTIYSTIKTIVNEEIKSTRQPEFNEYTSSDEDNYDYSNEISVDMGPLITPNNVSTTTSTGKIKHVIKDTNKDMTPEDNLEHSGNSLKIKIPDMLARVFEMALRKSMVSLSGKTKCIPGSTSTKQCNMCFCLKNGKLLCTTNKCK